ncbi:MAG: hypothetical protein JNM82_14620 [Rhodocyclaceae bacterium]|nr:hypothetical protein [Rhodocyclaceae bacterium]
MQYINLVNPSLRQRRDPLTLALATGLALAGIAVIAGLAAVTGQQATAAQRRLAAAEERLKQLRGEMTTLGNQAAARQADPKLNQDLARLQARIDGRQEILAALESPQVGNTTGFSDVMKAFSRQAAGGIWLTGFTVDQGGRQMRLAGRALEARQVPAYLDRLNAEKTFQGRSFAALDMKASPDPKSPGAKPPVPGKAELRYTEFVLATEGLAEADKR